MGVLWRSTFLVRGRGRACGRGRWVRSATLMRESLRGGVGERASHDGVHFVDDRGGEPVALLATCGRERVVGVVEVFSADRPEWYRPTVGAMYRSIIQPYR